MRGKRSKQYRKLMQQYGLTFGFREPYQVLIDADMVQDASRFSMDLVPALTRTLHGQVKPMITQCSMRHLYLLPTTSDSATASATTASKPSSSSVSESNPTSSPPIHPTTKASLIAQAQTFERRRCGHHVLPAPLSALDCLRAVIDARDTGTNRHRYVLASQDLSVRRWARAKVRGVPSVYVRRSVMIMEPMAAGSVGVREGAERGKLRGGVRESGAGKRKRENEERDVDAEAEAEHGGNQKKTVRRAKGPKEPNPLSVKKAKVKVLRTETGDSGTERRTSDGRSRVGKGLPGAEARGTLQTVRRNGLEQEEEVAGSRRKRKRKHAAVGTEEKEAETGVEEGKIISVLLPEEGLVAG